VTGTIAHFEPLLLSEEPFRTEHLWQQWQLYIR
jgi:hypothetical protein